jgi:serine protease Do
MILTPLRPRSLSRRAILAALCLTLALPGLASAQRGGKGKGGFGFGGTNGVEIKAGDKFKALFRPVVAEAAKSTVRVRFEGKDFGLGVVVSADGYILTQATDVEGKYAVKLRDGKTLDARLVGVHQKHNLALLKVDASGQTPAKWADSKAAAAGDWVAAVGMKAEPTAVGVIGVATRDVPGAKGARRSPASNGGFLGVGLADEGPGAIIKGVEPNTAAARAGLKIDDVILSVSGKQVADAEELVRTLGRHKPGDTVTLLIRRGEEEMEVKAKLGERPKGGVSRGDFQNLLGSKLSDVRSGYPTILQHDGVVPPEDCGGPLVDLDGRVLGINICRAGRTETWAVPSEVIRAVLPDLMAGHLASKQATPK